MRMKRQGCINPTDGAWCAARSTRSSVGSSTALPGSKWRMSRRASTSL